MELKYKIFNDVSQQHYELLLDADPSKNIVDSYLKRSFCVEALLNDNLVGVIILLPTRPEILEIVNLAISVDYRGQGMGEKLINYALTFAKERHYKTVEIGTGSIGFQQLYLYQKCGFRMVSIDRDFFTKHYNDEIIENNLVLRDMVRLSQDI